MGDVVYLETGSVGASDGVRETIERYFEQYSSNTPVVDDVLPAEHFLMWLWTAGLKIVPFDQG